MDTSRRRSGVKVRLAAGSVWESRMQTDNVKGDIFKEFTDSAVDDDDNRTGDQFNEKKNKKEAALAVSGKRKTWNSDCPDDHKSPIQVGGAKAPDDQSRKAPPKLTRPRSNLSFHTRKSPIPTDKARSEAFAGRRPKSGSPEANEKSSPVPSKKLIRSESLEGNARTSIRFTKTRSDLSNEAVKSDDHHKHEPSNSAQLRKSFSSPAKNSGDPKKLELGAEDDKPVDPPGHDKEEAVEEKEQDAVEVKEFGVCQETIISTSSNKDEQIDEGDEDKNEGVAEEFVDGGEEEEEEEEEEVDEEIKVEKKSIDVEDKNVIKQTEERVVKETKKFHNNLRNRAAPSSSNVNKLNPSATKSATAFYSAPPPRPSSQGRVPDEYQNIPQCQGKLQSLVDLVMWKEVSRSALAFGMGTFLIISSTYARDLEISLISVVAYVGLVYLAAIFVFRTVIHRGNVEREREERRQVELLREEEALWILRLVLPYLNEFLFSLRALFCGDPATTLKLGIALFVMARCGSSITIWKMAKLGFFGVFTVPKIFSTYSTYLSAYAQFWMRRFRDAWESCSHKKAVAFALFTLFWNLSSVVARVWAAFMLFVALRYYQQKMMGSYGWRDENEEEEEAGEEEEEEGMDPKGLATPYSNRILLPNKLKRMS